MNPFLMKNTPLAHGRPARMALVWTVLVFVLMALMSLTPHLAQAGEGHDHGQAVPAAVGHTLPRVTSSSDLFELVGVVDRGEMVIYLDRFETNTPVLNATIEVDMEGVKGMAKAQPDGTYHFAHVALSQPGSWPISFTVTAGADTDLLAGDLEVGSTNLKEPKDSKDLKDTAPQGARLWQRWAVYGAAILGFLVILAVTAKRLLARSKLKDLATVLIATGVGIYSATASFDAYSGEGHSHDAAAPTASSNSPRRLPDGSVFLPKIAQRQLGVRTVLAEVKSLPATLELGGIVIMDANAGGRVQPTIAGRLEAGPRGLPQLGQAVRKGEVLARVRASSNPIERGNQLAQSAELQARLALARKRADRLAQLEGTVAQKDQDEAQAEVISLQQRLVAVAASVSATEALISPVSGVIASARAQAGQVVDARELLFEIIDPTRLRVEASAFDAGLAANIASATLSAGSGVGAISIPLTFSGAGASLREGAIPLQFQATSQQALPLAVNQPVKVIVQTKNQIKGVRLPASALVKTPSNQDMVWVHAEPETFVPRTVRFMVLDGTNVSITDGLQAQDRVVTQGAALLNQVR